MSSSNILNWIEKILFLSVIALIAGFVALSIGTIKKSYWGDGLANQAEDLNRKVKVIETKADKIKVIDEVLQNKIYFSKVVAELYGLISDNVMLTSLRIKDYNSFTIQGIAASGSDVNDLQKKMVSSSLFQKVDLEFANKRKTEDGELTYFKLTSEIVP